MSFKTEKTVYFNETGIGNTDTTLKMAKERAKTLGIKSIVVASTRGETGAKTSETFKGYNVIIVTHSTGFKESDGQELTPENREKILKNGAKILTTTHAFGGIGRAIRRHRNTYQYDEIIADTLRIFGQGTKVACEIVIMAADAGLISTKENVVAVAGTGGGLDTALVIKPANVQDFFNLNVREIICKPSL